MLPTPDVNIRLVSHWNNGAKYQISLKNLADYAVFSNWKVTFRLGSQTVTIDQNNHTAEISGDDLKELIVTAAAGITNGIQPASVTDTIPTDTPKYKPDGSINKLSVSYSGSTVDDYTVTAALTVNEPQMETPPIYRIEVLGTVGTNEYVFAYGQHGYGKLPRPAEGVFRGKCHKSSGACMVRHLRSGTGLHLW